MHLHQATVKTDSRLTEDGACISSSGSICSVIAGVDRLHMALAPCFAAAISQALLLRIALRLGGHFCVIVFASANLDKVLCSLT